MAGKRRAEVWLLGGRGPGNQVSVTGQWDPRALSSPRVPEWSKICGG